MDLNYVLLWIVGFSSFGSLFRTAKLRGQSSRGWLAVLAFILAVEGVGLAVRPEIAGYVAGATWLVLFVIPAVGGRYLARFATREEYAKAAMFARVLGWLHPFDGWPDAPRVWEALELARRGEIEPAVEILTRISNSRSPLAPSATMHLYRIQARWEEALVWLRLNVPESQLRRDIGLTSLCLRSLGETGDLAGMVRFFAESEPFLRAAQATAQQSLARMMLFAFCGRTRAVAEMFAGPLFDAPEKVKKFWLATAELAAGNNETARHDLRAMLSDDAVRLSVERRLNHPPANPREVLTAADEQLLDRVEREWKHEQRYAALSLLGARRPVITWTLAALNAVAFLAEALLGGTMNDETLFRLGAVVPVAVWVGHEWWRLLAASFLHFGWLHLAMNMLGLLAIGPFVERALGRGRYAVCYLCAGVISNGLVVALGVRGALRYELLIGASGCVMGLVGATAAICWRDWRKLRSDAALRRLRWAALVVILQTMFDLATPQVSFAAHIGGAAAGLCLAALLHRGEGENDARAPV